ncbi:aminotransferase class V-fold PLP-dependent enzyme [Streptomyces sp. ET3-23]|uniref:aminotransferase class V-fold PLP-dependent enzyme n=1 Tax=Streptomyces sp. ET3-23 TaxID=2885643 RepID=UPI001D10CAD6|nr:aminotransferase class V-fold PLP-dependent enzyme [Streptomyces sp. ET3-23]MCC2280470.1 aminotransferase class V-fold PLP-dependent enzyme [Streptomyces sp. ET3-23]
MFLDSAGCSLMPRQVLDEVVGHLRREAEIGGYRAADERRADLDAGYGVVAELLGCRPDQVAFTDSATRSWLAAFDAVPLAAGDRILIGEVEYAGNAVPLLMRAEAVGATVEVAPSDRAGVFSTAALEEMLDERVKLVSLVHVPTNGGVVNAVRRVADAAHAVGALLILDACQSAGQLRLDANELDADIVTFTGRKWLRGPRGTGALIVRDRAAGLLRPRLADLRGGSWCAPGEYQLRTDAQAFELWEAGIAQRLGLIRAVRYALRLGVGEIEAAVKARAARLRVGLVGLAGVIVHDLGVDRCGIVTFTVEGTDSARVRDVLAGQGVTVNVSRRPSTLVDMTRRGLSSIVRASPHYFVDDAQIDRCIDVVADVGRPARPPTGR